MNNTDKISKISRNFQVTIPVEARSKFNLKVGDYVKYSLEGNRIILEQLYPTKDDIISRINDIFNHIDTKNKFPDDEDNCMDMINSEIILCRQKKK